MDPERRRFPRKRVDKLTYIHLEPDNGAIVLNASEAGLGFHAAGPIEGQGPLAFSLSIEGHEHIKIESEVVWVDAQRKMGGLRLVTSPEECRALALWLERLIGEPVAAAHPVLSRAHVNDLAQAVPAAEPAAAAATEPELKAETEPEVEPEIGYPTEVIAVESEPRLDHAHSSEPEPALEPEPEIAAPEPPEMAPAGVTAPAIAASRAPQREEPAASDGVLPTAASVLPSNPLPAAAAKPNRARMSSASLGFAMMIWFGVACWLGAAVWLLHVEFGQARVRPDERTVNWAQQKSPAVGAAPGAISTSAPTSASGSQAVPSAEADAAAMQQLHDEVAALESEYTDDEEAAPPVRSARARKQEALPKSALRERSSLARVRGNDGARTRDFDAKPAAARFDSPARINSAGFLAHRPSGGSIGSAYPAVTFAPTPPGAGPAPAALQNQQTETQIAPGGNAAAEGAVKTPADDDPLDDAYFDIGRFKDLAAASAEAEQLEQMGMHSVVVAKRLLWMRAFHVVVGPYKTDDQADAARAKLQPLGFRPRYARAPSSNP